jgi:hypothetical protein
MDLTLDPEGGHRLPASHHSLLTNIPKPVAGTVSMLSPGGGVRFGPKEGREIIFGRNRPLVHVCIGEDDLRISRHHGTVRRTGDRWWISNEGTQPIRVADSYLLYRGEDPIPLDTGYTPLLIRGSERREHLLEVFVTTAQRSGPTPRHRHETHHGIPYALSVEEKLALIVLGQRYLRREPYPQPLTWKETAKLLTELQPGMGWKQRRVEELVAEVRHRLTLLGVDGLMAQDVPPPIGNMLNHNLFQELMVSGTLTPNDLEQAML